MSVEVLAGIVVLPLTGLSWSIHGCTCTRTYVRPFEVLHSKVQAFQGLRMAYV